LKPNTDDHEINLPGVKKEETVGVSLLLGEPEKAIRKLSGPLIIAMLLYSTYNIVNAIWVAGLGSAALAAVGLYPHFLVLHGLEMSGAGTPLQSHGSGAGALQGANNAAFHESS
jgi:Na+-driven multidrug efflux pump